MLRRPQLDTTVDGSLHCRGPGSALVVTFTPRADRAWAVIGETTPVRINSVAGNRGGEFLGFERGDKTLGHRRPCYVVPLDWNDHGPVIGLADGEPAEMRDAGDRPAVVQIGHQLGTLLEGDRVVFVLAGRGLTDEFGLAGDVAELREGCDEDRLGGRRNSVVIQEGVSGRPGDAHIV